MAPRSYDRFCPLSLALDQVGDRWTLLILTGLLRGASRYGELDRFVSGAGSNVSPTTSGKSCTASIGFVSVRKRKTVAGSAAGSSGASCASACRRAAPPARRTAWPERRTTAPTEAPVRRRTPMASAVPPRIVARLAFTQGAEQPAADCSICA